MKLQPFAGRYLSRVPLLQVMLAFQNTPEAEAEADTGLEAVPYSAGTGTAKFDLTFFLAEQYDEAGQPAGIGGSLQYARDLYDRQTAAEIVGRLVRVLEAVAARLDRGCMSCRFSPGRAGAAGVGLE